MQNNYFLIRVMLFIQFILAAGYSQAQIAQTVRKEFPIEEEYGHSVSPFTNLKSILYSYSILDKKAGLIHHTLEFWTEDFKVIEKKQISYDRDYTTQLTYSSPDHYYILFFNRGKGHYDLYDVNMVDRSIKNYKGTFIPKMLLNEFYVIGQVAFLSGEFKAKHQIFVLNLSTNQYKNYVAQEMTEAKLRFNDMQFINSNGVKEVLFKYYSCDKQGCDMYVKIFNEDGTAKDNFLIISKPDADKELTSISLSKNGNDSYFITGTFGIKSKKGQVGLYFSRVTNSRVDFIKYYNFLDLTNFTSYLSDKQRDKIERKSEKAAGKGDELYLNYLATIHDIVEKNGEYIFLAEFYYPTYRTETYTTFSNGQSVTRTRQVFDGYQYSHAALAGFDKLGTMLWSNTFEMWLNQKPFAVKQFIRQAFDGNSIELVFASGKEIKTTSFTNGKVLKNRTVNTIETSDSEDVIKRSYNIDIVWWYGQNYLSTGNQIIKNSENERGNKKREVYFINKITY